MTARRVSLFEADRLRELIGAGTWPDGWSGDEQHADILTPEVLADGVVQNLLFNERTMA